MKPAEAIGLLVWNRHFGRSQIVEHLGGRRFRCMTLEKSPGTHYTTSWLNLKRLKS
jgi:hypothetical protein